MATTRKILRPLACLLLVGACGEVEPMGLYYTPTGATPLVAAEDVAGLRGAIAAGAPRLAPNTYLVAADAVSDGERLPAYYTADGFGPLVADERIRARFALHVEPETVKSLVRELGGASAEQVRPSQNIYDIRATRPEDCVRLAEALQNHALWAHPDFFQPVTRTVIPNDTFLYEQWHHSVIRTPSAWDTTQGTADVRIAVIDTGIDMTHPDLANKVVAPFDAFDNDNDPSPDDDAPHGTACAGLAAAVTGNNTGIAGVCPECSLVPVRIQASGMTRLSAISDSFYWAVEHGARVISSSWSTELSSDLQNAMEYAANEAFDGRGAVLFFASGNDGVAIPANGPAAHSDVIAVGATNPFDIREDYSNVGPELDLTAPAGSMTTDIQGASGYASGDYTNDFNGTSAATPVAAGVAGLLLSIDPDLPRAQLEAVLRSTATRVDAAAAPYVDGRNDDYGFGRIDAAAAVQMVHTGFGRECVGESDCGPGSTCLAKVGGIGGTGLCTIACQVNDACPADMTCRTAADTGGSCFATCMTNNDCNPGSSCWPGADGEPGHCMAACKFDSECGSDSCNPLGLCGRLQPPGQASFDPLVGHTDYSAIFSCHATGNGAWLGILVFLGLLALRRR